MGTVLQPRPDTDEVRPAAGEKPASGAGDSIIEKLWLPIGACVSLIAFLRLAAYGTRRLWYDEVSTAIVALQPSWTDVWKAFAAGVDLQPPLFSYVTRLFWLLFGRSELGMRMPEILGILVFSWCLFFFVRPRLGTAFGLSAMILPLVTNLIFYGGEARPYGMIVGACGLSLLAWRNAIENPKRRLALPLFAVSLMVIVSLHAYAIIAVLAFALTEFIRFAKTRKADLWLWACYLSAFPLLAIYWLPMHSGKTAGGVLGPSEWTHWSAVFWFYEYFFSGRVLLLLLLGVLAVSLLILRRAPGPRTGGMPWHETVLAVALAAAPAGSIAVAVYVTRYYRPRYSIFALTGLAILTVYVFDRIAPNRRAAAWSLLVISLGLFALDQRFVQFNREEMKKRDAELAVPFTAVPPDMPLVIASGLAMLPTDWYASDTELSRTYYLYDTPTAVRYTGSTFFNWTSPAYVRYYHFRAHLENYYSFVKSHKKFWVYGPYFYSDDWQVRKLKDDGAHIVEKGHYSGVFTDNYLLEVELP